MNKPEKVLFCIECHGNIEYTDSNFKCSKCGKIYTNNKIVSFLKNEYEDISNIKSLDKIDDIKAKISNGYSFVSSSLKEMGISDASRFLNLGYIANEKPQYAIYEPDTDQINKNSVKLLYEVLGDYNPDNKTILEVGCGRGGNVETISRKFNVKLLIGVDICKANITACSNIKNENTAFFVADAEELPFLDNSFDMVYNIESSDSYPNIEKFYRHVHRILKTNGYFLYADMFPPSIFTENIKMLIGMGFEIIRDVDISSNVLLSCYQTGKRRMKAYKTSKEWQDKALEEFLAVPGSKAFQELKNGTQVYKIFALKKVNST